MCGIREISVGSGQYKEKYHLGGGQVRSGSGSG
jgi:hypothetical protein